MIYNQERLKQGLLPLLINESTLALQLPFLLL
jgi:hypothetical protein